MSEPAGHPPPDAGVPADFHLAAAAGLTRTPGALVGGEPFAVWRVDPDDETGLDTLLAGAPVGPWRHLARALVARNLAQPVPPATAAGPGVAGEAGPPGSARAPRGAGAQVAVVVPVRNRAAALERLLPALRETTGAALDELVVVDDASDDAGATPAAALRCGARLVTRGHRGGPGAARNSGLAATGAPLVAFVDSDCLPRPGWLEPLLAHLADPLVGIVAPRVVALDVRPAGRVARYEAVRSPLDRGGQPRRVVPGGAVPFVPGAALLARREALGEGFDPSLPGGEDVDLVWRCTGAGWHVRYEPGGEVAHDHRPGLGGLVGRRLAYGRAAPALARRHPGAAPPVTVSPWTLAAYLAVAAGQPAVAGGVIAAATALAACRVRGTLPDPLRSGARLAALGSVASWQAVADTAVRAALPLSLSAAIALPRLRPALAVAAVAPPLAEWHARRPPLGPLAWTALRLADDASYGIGAWYGALRDGRPDLLVRPMPWRLAVLPLRPVPAAAP